MNSLPFACSHEKLAHANFSIVVPSALRASPPSTRQQKEREGGGQRERESNKAKTWSLWFAASIACCYVTPPSSSLDEDVDFLPLGRCATATKEEEEKEEEGGRSKFLLCIAQICLLRRQN